jgi:hypothetical protein
MTRGTVEHLADRRMQGGAAKILGLSWAEVQHLKERAVARHAIPG